MQFCTREPTHIDGETLTRNGNSYCATFAVIQLTIFVCAFDLCESRCKNSKWKTYCCRRHNFQYHTQLRLLRNTHNYLPMKFSHALFGFDVQLYRLCACVCVCVMSSASSPAGYTYTVMNSVGYCYKWLAQLNTYVLVKLSRAAMKRERKHHPNYNIKYRQSIHRLEIESMKSSQQSLGSHSDFRQASTVWCSITNFVCSSRSVECAPHDGCYNFKRRRHTHTQRTAHITESTHVCFS